MAVTFDPESPQKSDLGEYRGKIAGSPMNRIVRYAMVDRVRLV